MLLVAVEYPNLAYKVISLDYRRMIIPCTVNLK